MQFNDRWKYPQLVFHPGTQLLLINLSLFTCNLMIKSSGGFFWDAANLFLHPKQVVILKPCRNAMSGGLSWLPNFLGCEAVGWVAALAEPEGCIGCSGLPSTPWTAVSGSLCLALLLGRKRGSSSHVCRRFFLECLLVCPGSLPLGLLFLLCYISNWWAFSKWVTPSL